MGTIIIKPEPDEDFYVLWSTVTGGPGFRGTRDEVAAELESDPDYYGYNGNPVAQSARFARADATGTSSYGRIGSWWSEGFVVNWDAEGEVEVGPRWLPRGHLGGWLRTGDESLTEPAPDD